jgi:hypothetical protein
MLHSEFTHENQTGKISSTDGTIIACECGIGSSYIGKTGKPLAVQFLNEGLLERSN